MKFHAMRRTAASHFAAAGGDASHFLGHSSPRITEKYYLDPRIADTGPQPCDVLPGVN
jgi:integrase